MKSNFRTSLPKATSWGKSTRKQGGAAKGSLPFPWILLAALLLALALGSPGQTPPAQAAPAAQAPVIIDVEYFMDLGPRDVELCVGQTEDFYLHVALVVTEQIGSQAPFETNEYYPGEQVRTTVEVPAIGTFSPQGQTTGPAPGPGWQLLGYRTWSGSELLTFEFTAKKAGYTIVRFEHLESNKPLTHARSEEARITVTDCYEAVTGGVGATFTKNEICGFETPFVLEGVTTNIGNTGANLNTTTFFWPFALNLAQPDPHGRFVNMDILTTGPASCVTLTSGTFDVDFLAQNEVNITMTGGGFTYCGPVPIPVSNIGTQIKVKPAAVCQGP